MSRDKLVAAAAKIEHQRREVKAARAQLAKRATRQLDSMPDTIHTVEQHVAVDHGGGPFAARRLRVLHDERGRLDRFVANSNGDD